MYLGIAVKVYRINLIMLKSLQTISIHFPVVKKNIVELLDYFLMSIIHAMFIIFMDGEDNTKCSRARVVPYLV